ncbi:MAG: hypothetical protein ABW200_03050, partial [Hyphomicrobiaceae bacterium]
GQLGGHHILYNRYLETPVMPKTSKARAIGLNHIALEVGGYRGGSGLLRAPIELTLRGKSEHAAFHRSGRLISCSSERP